MEYPNVPRRIGMIISHGHATLHELSTVYGTEDAYNLIEIAAVDAYNRRQIAKRRED